MPLMRKTIGTIALWLITLLLALAFFAAGAAKFPMHGQWARMFAQWHFPVWFRIAIAVLEIAAALLILWPRTATIGASLIVVIMLGGMATHIWWNQVKELPHEAIPLVLATIVATARRRASIVPLALAALLLAPIGLAAEGPGNPPGIPPARIDMIGGAEIYSIDQAHSYVGFNIDFIGLTTVRGTFKDYGATILYDDAHPERSSATLIIDTASIDTNNQFRDRDLKAKFFEVEKYPEIRFQSTRIEAKGANKFLVHGNLTIKDVTKEIAIPMTRTVSRRPDSIWGNIRIGGTGGLLIHRKEFHVDGGSAFGALADDVNIDLEVLGNRPNYDRWTWQAKEKPSVGETIFKTAMEKDGAAAAAQLRDIGANHAADFTFEPGQVNLAVNRLLQRRRVADALEIINAALAFWPNEPGFHARAGEAYATLGKRDDAVREYQKALALKKNGTESIEMLRRLQT